MKFFVECGILWILVVAATANAQSGNYLMDSIDSTMEILEYFNFEVDYYREALLWEAEDMGYYFTWSLTEAARVAYTEDQGEGLRRCAEIVATACESNIHWFEDQLRELEKDTRELHLSIYNAFGPTNIVTEGGYMIYYNHNIFLNGRMQLLAEHDTNLLNAWFDLYLRFFELDVELDYCIEAVMLPRK